MNNVPFSLCEKDGSMEIEYFVSIYLHWTIQFRIRNYYTVQTIPTVFIHYNVLRTKIPKNVIYTTSYNFVENYSDYSGRMLAGILYIETIYAYYKI